MSKKVIKNKKLSTRQVLLFFKKEGWKVIKLGKVYGGNIVERTIDLSKIKE